MSTETSAKEKKKLDQMMDWLNDGDPDSDCTWVPDGPPPPNTKLGVQEKGKPAPVVPLTKQQLNVLSPSTAALDQQFGQEGSPLDRSASPCNAAPAKRNIINVTHTSQMSPTLGARPRGLSTASASSYSGGAVPNNSLTSMPTLEGSPSLGSVPAASGTYQRPRGGSTASVGVPNNSLISVPSSTLGVPNNSVSHLGGDASLGSVPSASGFKQRERALSNVSLGTPGVPNNSLVNYPSLGAVSPPPQDPSRNTGTGRPRSISTTSSIGVPGVPNNSMSSLPGGLQMESPTQMASPIQQRPRGVSTASSVGGPGVPNNSMVSAGDFQYQELSMEIPAQSSEVKTPLNQRPRAVSTASSVGGPGVPNNSMASLPGGLQMESPTQMASPIQQRPRAVSTASSVGGPGVPNNSMVSAGDFQYETLLDTDSRQTTQTPAQRRLRAASTTSSVGAPQAPNNSMVSGEGLVYEMPEIANADKLGSVGSNALSHEAISGSSAPGLSASDVLALRAQRNRSVSMASTGSAAQLGVPNNSLASVPPGGYSLHQDPNSSSQILGQTLPSPIGAADNSPNCVGNSSIASMPSGLVPNNSLASMPGGVAGGVPVSHTHNMSFEGDGMRAPQNSVAGSIGMLTPAGDRSGLVVPVPGHSMRLSPKVLYMPSGKLPAGLEQIPGDNNPLQDLPNSGPHSGPESREDSAGCSPNNRSPPNGRLGQDPQQMTSAAYAAIAQLRASQHETICLQLELSAMQDRSQIERQFADEQAQILYCFLKESRHSWDFSSRSAGAAVEPFDEPSRSLVSRDTPMTESQKKAVEDSQIEQNNRKLIANDLVKELYESNREMSNQIKEMAVMVVQQQSGGGRVGKR